MRLEKEILKFCNKLSIKVNLLVVFNREKRSFVNFSTGASVLEWELEMELELKLILQRPLFPVP